MPTGTIKSRLRPLRLAFLVSGAKRSDYLTAIQTSSYLWGGAYNPIIPYFRRLPKAWRRDEPTATADEILRGYLDTFDPDFVVKVGELEQVKLEFGHREIIDCSDILRSVRDDGTPSYGIGMLEVMDHLVETELKFERREPLEFILPQLGARHRLFLASIFGQLSDECEEVFAHRFGSLPELEYRNCSIRNYWGFLKSDNQFLRRIGRHGFVPSRNWHQHGDCLFLMDAANLQDVIDYWNLRATGWTVIPVCRQQSGEDELLRFAAQFVDQNSLQHRSNPDLYHHTHLFGGRGVPLSELEEFGRKLKPLLRKPKDHLERQIVYRPAFPRIWEMWAQRTGEAEICELNAGEEERTIGVHENTISLKGMAPEFASRFGGHGTPRCANEVNFSLWGTEFSLAEVVPEGGFDMARAAGVFDCLEWRSAKSGLVHLPKHIGMTEHLDLVPADTVFHAWLQKRGWKAELSDKGHVGRQMLKQLGGVWGTSLLAKKGIIKLIKRITSNPTGLHEDEFRREVMRIAEDQEFKLPSADALMRGLTGSKIAQPGFRVQCDVCRQNSWYFLTDADYSLKCPKCLEEFALPCHDLARIKWTYRTIGPFSLPHQAYGSYAVLLTLRFFSRILEGATTPIMSFTASKKDTSIESDLGIFYQESKFRRSRTELIYAECKTYNQFETKDAKRMMVLGSEFPGAFLVFSTLRTKLEKEEKAFLVKIAERARRAEHSDSQHNPVLILTGNELLSDRKPWYTWEDMGGAHARISKTVNHERNLLALSYASQQLYLGMKSRHDWATERSRQPRPGKSKITKGRGPTATPLSFSVQS